MIYPNWISLKSYFLQYFLSPSLSVIKYSSKAPQYCFSVKTTLQTLSEILITMTVLYIYHYFAFIHILIFGQATDDLKLINGPFDSNTYSATFDGLPTGYIISNVSIEHNNTWLHCSSVDIWWQCAYPDNSQFELPLSLQVTTMNGQAITAIDAIQMKVSYVIIKFTDGMIRNIEENKNKKFLF